MKKAVILNVISICAFSSLILMYLLDKSAKFGFDIPAYATLILFNFYYLYKIYKTKKQVPVPSESNS